ncbi:MAG: glycosyltransferase family 4 protein [Thermoplasmatota archaeon]
MRITLVSPFDPFPAEVDGASAHVGGVERVLGEVALGLSRRGHDVHVVCSHTGRKRNVEGLSIERRRRLTVLRTPLSDLQYALPRDSDVVHVPATYPFTTAPVLRRCHRLRIPAVLDFHFEPVVEGALARLGAALYRRLAPRSYRLADAVVVRSLAYGRSAASLASVPEGRWRAVPNGIDPRTFFPRGNDPGSYVLFVGRLVPYKGVDRLLWALSRHPVGMPLVVAGDGPERARLEQLAARLGVETRFLGRVADGDLPTLYRNARVTVLPSVNQQEAFGITLLESMACGTPVVASDLPGVAELARVGGTVAPPGDVEALGQAIAAACRRDGPPRAALGRRIHAQFSWDAVTDRMESTYIEAVLARTWEVNHPNPRRGALLST